MKNFQDRSAQTSALQRGAGRVSLRLPSLITLIMHSELQIAGNAEAMLYGQFCYGFQIRLKSYGANLRSEIDAVSRHGTIKLLKTYMTTSRSNCKCNDRNSARAWLFFLPSSLFMHQRSVKAKPQWSRAACERCPSQYLYCLCLCVRPSVHLSIIWSR